ncbi:MAG: hypothetical protein K0R18_424 [Bacillales bacterium]|jgi:hypothetical protein|nr:hypothetical protein [Bacillales bacterium]
MAKSMIAQIREEMETYIVGWNLTDNRPVRITEYPDPKSSKYSFSIRLTKSRQRDSLSFDFIRPNGSIYTKVSQFSVGEENIEWLKQRYKFVEGGRKHAHYAGSIGEILERFEREFLFELNKPSDVYDILVKVQPLYLL